MAIFALYGRGIPRVPSESLPAERALWPSFMNMDLSTIHLSESLPAERALWHSPIVSDFLSDSITTLGKSARWKGYFGLSKFLNHFPTFRVFKMYLQQFLLLLPLQ